MEKERLLDLIKSNTDEDALGMILSNCTDQANSNGGMISLKAFDSVIELVISWKDAKLLEQSKCRKCGVVIDMDTLVCSECTRWD